MTQELFYGWISKHFPNHLPPGRPVCLLVDGHSSHIDLDISKFCAANQLLLYCLPLHTSHVLQPLDVGFFAPLKRAWQDAVAQHQLDEGKVIDKRSFARVFRSAYENVVRLSTIVNAYTASGIYPVSRHAINPMKLEPAKAYPSEACSSSNEAPPCTFKPGPGAYKLALQALEDELDEGTICLFNRKYEEGYDVTDALYTAWAKLKRSTQPLADRSNTKGKSHRSIPAPIKSRWYSDTQLSSMQQWSAARRYFKGFRATACKENNQNSTTTQAPIWGGDGEVPRGEKVAEDQRSAGKGAKKKQREEEKQQKAAKKKSKREAESC